MATRPRDLAVGAVVVGLLAFGAWKSVQPGGDGATPSATPTATPTGVVITDPAVASSLQPMEVVRVNDGDTFTGRFLDDGPAGAAGSQTDVRLLEINTPEVPGPYRDAQCFGEEASAETKKLLRPGTRVYVEPDRELRDKYDRTLLYVYFDAAGQRMLNEALVRQGFAEAVLYRPNDRYIDRMDAAEQAARSEGLGLWSAC